MKTKAEIEERIKLIGDLAKECEHTENIKSAIEIIKHLKWVLS